MSDWIWVKNEAVNNIPGRVPADSLPAWEARGFVQCPEPADDVEVDAQPVDEPAPEEQPDAEAAEQKPSTRGQKKES